MGQILAFLWSKGLFFFGPFFIFVFLLTLTPYGKLWKNNTNRKRWIGDLYQNNWKARYRRTMGRILDRIDQTLSVHELKAQAKPARIAFSYGLINLSMLLAIAYPVLDFIGQWVFGSALHLGNTQIAPAGSATARSFVIFLLLALWLLIPWLQALLFISLSSIKEKLRSRLRLLLLFLPLLTLYGGMSFGNRFGVPNPIIGTIGFVYMFIAAGARGGSLAIAGAVAGVVAIVLMLAITGLAAGLFAGAIAISIALTKTEAKFGSRPVFRILYLLLLLLSSSVLILRAPEFATTAKVPPTYLLLFLTTFLIFNALADFTSAGLTRYLLRRGLTKPVWFNALLDTLGGVLIFFLLGFALISYIHFVRPQDGTPLLDLAALFNQLKSNPSDFWWLALMLGSTLLPTLLHLMIGVATILIQYPTALRKWTISKLTSGGEGSDTDGWQGSAMVCFMISASFWLPIIMFYYLFTMNHSAVINGTIWLFSSYADLIGAL